MAAASTYKREDVIITIEGPLGLGSFILEGYAEGTFCTVEPDGDGWTKTNGSHQHATRNRMKMAGGKMTITLQGGSPSNRDLYELWKLDDETGSSPFAITVRDIRSGGKLAHAAIAYVMQVPNLEFGDEISDVEWPIDCLDLTIEHAGQLGIVPAAA